MWTLLQRRWFLTALLILIVAGLSLGAGTQGAWLSAVMRFIKPRLTTAMILFLMAFSLETRSLGASLRQPGPVLWATMVNFGLIPLLGWSLMPWQRSGDFTAGLMIAASVPCTMAAASVWTRKAGGNDAISLMVTMLTNSLCFAVTPFWLNLTTAGDVSLDAGYMVRRLLEAVLVPVCLGQAARQFRKPAEWATRYKTPIGVAAQILILSLVFSAASQAGRRLAGSGPNPDLMGVGIVWITCIVVHLLAMVVGSAGASLWGFPRRDRIAVTFASSQKTLPIGVLVATDPGMFGSLPFAVFPMLMYHASQLFIDTAVADRLAAGKPTESSAQG